MMKFFTKKWYPWNIIILILSILLIAILIWGGSTNWKFTSKKNLSQKKPLISYKYRFNNRKWNRIYQN